MHSGQHTLPGVILPAFSASVIMLYPILHAARSEQSVLVQQACQRLTAWARLSLTEEQGSMISSLAATLALGLSIVLFRYTIGVLPARAAAQGACEVRRHATALHATPARAPMRSDTFLAMFILPTATPFSVGDMAVVGGSATTRRMWERCCPGTFAGRAVDGSLAAGTCGAALSR